MVCVGVTRERAIDGGRVKTFRFWVANGRLTGGSATPRVSPLHDARIPRHVQGTKGDIVHKRSHCQPSDKHHQTLGKSFLT